MKKLVVYSPQVSNRLTYVLDWLLCERLQLDYIITTSENEPADIIYGNISGNGISIPDQGLLWQNCTNSAINMHRRNEAVIPDCQPAHANWKGIPVLFPNNGEGYTLPFDMLSAIFFLLTRYEEYLPYKADHHHRYPPAESILYKLKCLSRPVADEWVAALKSLLEQKRGAALPLKPFSFLPTYDIDMAYSHAYKGIARIVGAYIRAMLKGDVQQINERTQVLKKKKKDPYDSFSWLRHLHEQYGYRPVYFILCALKTTAYDKNIHPRHPAMTRVIKQLAKEGETGIHPSYNATRYEMVAKEKKALEQIAGNKVMISRQHYIKLKVPDTFRLLLDNEITEDYSMGYGSQLGFRAGTGSSFLWYDLENEKVAKLRIHPFCFMDTTAHYELGLSCEDAFRKLTAMTDVLRRLDSTMITVFHNFSLGTAAEWKGWNVAYEHYLAKMASLKTE